MRQRIDQPDLFCLNSLCLPSEKTLPPARRAGRSGIKVVGSKTLHKQSVDFTSTKAYLRPP